MKSKIILKINDPSEIKPLMSAVERYVEYIYPEAMIRHVHGVFNLKRIDVSKGGIKHRCYIYMTKTKQIIAEVVGKGTEIRLAEAKQRIEQLENEAKNYWRKND